MEEVDYAALAQAELDRRNASQEAAPIEQEPDYAALAAAELAKRNQPAVETQPNAPVDYAALAQAELAKSSKPLQPVEPEEDPGLLHNLWQGGKYGIEDINRQKTILGQKLSGQKVTHIPVTQSAELDFSRKGIGQFTGRMIAGGAPTMAAGLGGAKLGAMAGTAVAPGAGTVIGGLAGGAAGGGTMGALQAWADAYNEALGAGQTDEQAEEYAGKVAKISGGINAVAGLAAGIGMKDAFIKHALKQIPIQTAASNVENVMRNVEAKESGVDPERETFAGAKEATFGPGIMHTVTAAGTKAIAGAKNAVTGTTPELKGINTPHETAPKPRVRVNPDTGVIEAPAKPRIKVNPETNKPILSADESNLSKQGATEAQKAAVDVNTDDVHQKLFGRRVEEKEPGLIKKWTENLLKIKQDVATEAGMFDAHAPLKAIDNAATPGENKGYRGARFARGVTGMVKAAFEYGRPYLDKVQQILRVNQDAPGLKTIIKSVAKTSQMAKDAEVYFASRRIKSQQLIEQGREQNITHADVERGLALEQKHPHFKAAFDEWKAYNDAQIDLYHDGGMISKAKADLWKETDYVPFPRDFEIEEGVRTPNQKGSQAKLVDQRLKVKRLKGDKKLWRVMDEHGNEASKDRFTSEKEAEAYAHNHNLKVDENQVGHKTKNIFESMLGNTAAFIPATMRNVAARNIIDKAVQLGGAVPIKKKDASNAAGKRRADVVSTMKNGKQKFFQITNEPLYKALNETLSGRGERGIFGKVAQGIKGIFSAAIVTEPSVAIAIAAKDCIQSGLVGKYNMGNIKGLLVDLPKELFNSLRHEFGIKIDPRLADISAMGAESRYANISPEVQMREIQRFTAENEGGRIPFDILKFPDKARVWIDKVLSGVEGANRLRKFEAARKAGKDLATSGYEALDYMDYGKKGSGEFANFLRDFVPFAGSHMSSSHTLGAELAHKGGANRTVANLMTFAAFSGMNAIINYDEKTDPDPSSGYGSLPQHIKDNYIPVDTWRLNPSRKEKGDFRWITIPKPWEAGQLGGTIVEKLIGIYKGEVDGAQINDYLFAQFRDYLTINPFGHPVIKTAYEEFGNKQSFLNMPIVPRETEELAPFMQYGPRTTETAKALGEAINFSPARIDHIGKGIMGSLYDYLAMVGDISINTMRNEKNAKPDKQTSDLYIFNKFIKGTPLERTSYESEMYEMYHTTKEAYKTLKKLEKQEKFDLADKYLAKNQSKIDEFKTVDQTRGVVKDYNEQIKKVLENKELTGKEKHEQRAQLLKDKNQYLYEWHRDMKAEKEAAGRKK